ncbi:hypothetical protein [Leptolyngbya ohadii]|uniref:hypothetical protein n=1 Tax=Leptolyngbya ohadii TaxID=1962290 RepID=UPI000B59DAF6|nr:hypothetical protein [Leptolyngbya ohadii]
MSQTTSQPPAPDANLLPKTVNGVRLTILAKNLKILSLQGLAIVDDQIIVPTIDGEIIAVNAIGAVKPLTNLLTVELGVPFGICAIDSGVVVTVSGFDPVHYLVKVSADGKHETIADLSEISGTYGAPFGVAAYDDGFIVAGTTDVISGDGALFRVTQQGQITEVVGLKQFGNALDVVVHRGQFITLHENGDLLRIAPTGEVTVLANLVQSGLGIPFKLTTQADNFLVTTNTGQVVRVDSVGKPVAIVELPRPTYSVPSGIALWGDDLIVSTMNGYLLRLQTDSNAKPD